MSVFCAILVWVGAFAVGCTFDATVGEGRCGTEGARSQGKVCRNGSWVDPNVDGRSIDAGEGADSDTGEDGSCGPGGCVRPDTSCPGGTDAGCGCTPGTERSCYGGPSGTAGVGICTAGTTTCLEDGTWGPCEMEVRPTEEVCGDQKDNDCNGTVDEGCGEERCNYMGRAEGVCADVEREEGDCPTPESFESEESSCDDGLDNDCDGATDALDATCNRRAGERCSESAQCLGQCVEFESATVCAHRVFVTSEQDLAGKFGGLSGGDSICNQAARAAGLQGSWRAILSDSDRSARDRIDVRAPIYTVPPQGGSARLVATSGGDLWDGSIEHPIDVTEQGTRIETAVWTGTNRDGTRDGSDPLDAGQNCADWQSDRGRDEGEAGLSNATDGAWLLATGVGGRNCSRGSALYCIDGP